MKLSKLVKMIRDGSNGAMYSLCNERAANGIGQGQNSFLDLRGDPCVQFVSEILGSLRKSP
jgi:hypothetical protein